VNASDQFHVGIVVDDLDATLASLTELFGYEWGTEVTVPTPVQLPSGTVEVELSFVYSRSTPRLEVIRSRPGTLWVPVEGSGIHHLGYWSDDVEADVEALAARGFAVEAQGVRPDGTPYWAYLRAAGGPRIELVSRSLQPSMEQLWGPPGSEG
jgi:catechol 2,3-dioxygenase-like lactoylglutathione lyase family enzyme